MNWATQIAARLGRTASSFIFWVVPEVVEPPHAKPIVIATPAPPAHPQNPCVTFASVPGFMGHTSQCVVVSASPLHFPLFRQSRICVPRLSRYPARELGLGLTDRNGPY